MTTLSIDVRHTPVADAVMAMRPEDLRMQQVFQRLPPQTAIRVVRRSAEICQNHMVKRAQEQGQAI